MRQTGPLTAMPLAASKLFTRSATLHNSSRVTTGPRIRWPDPVDRAAAPWPPVPAMIPRLDSPVPPLSFTHLCADPHFGFPTFVDHPGASRALGQGQCHAADDDGLRPRPKSGRCASCPGRVQLINVFARTSRSDVGNPPRHHEPANGRKVTRSQISRPASKKQPT